MTRGARLLILLATALLCGIACQSALAYWNGDGETGAGGADVATVEPGTAPTAIEEGAGTVTVSWEAGTLSNGVAVDGYAVERYDEETETLATIGPGCAGTITALTCTETEVPEGEWQYTVTPIFATNWRGLESSKSGGVAGAAGSESAATSAPLSRAVEPQPTEGTGASPESSETDATPEATAPTGEGAPSPDAPTTGNPESAPTNSLALAEPVGAYLGDGNLYYDGNAAGSFVLSDTLAGGAGPASVTYPSVDLAGWTHPAETVTTPTGGPYASGPFSWSAHPGAPGTYTVSGEDAGGGATTTLTFFDDESPPEGGGIAYPDGTVETTSVPITTVAGTDSLSGIDAEDGSVQRDETALNTTTGVCGTFPGTWANTVILVEGADTSVVSGNCYQYRYIASDNVGNLATYTSTNVVEVDTAAP
jgi:hypothetical protein